LSTSSAATQDERIHRLLILTRNRAWRGPVSKDRRGNGMTGFRTLDDLGDVRGKRVLVRVDLNVPMQDGAVSDDTRLRATLPTVTELADKGAIVLLLAHFGRPKAPAPEFSLARIRQAYESVLGRPVRYVDWEKDEAGVAPLRPGDVAILENTRFFGGEEKNDP